MRLNNTTIKKAKPKKKPYKLADGHGLYLSIRPTGRKIWRYDYRYQNKRKTYTIGEHPAITLKKARLELAEAKALLDQGRDPNIKKQQKKLVGDLHTHSLEALTREFCAMREKEYPSITLGLRRMEKHIFPDLGQRHIAEIEPLELLNVLQKIVARGTLETAKRTRTVCNQVYTYAIATGRAQRNIAQDLKGILPAPIKGKFAAITEPHEIAALLRNIDHYPGTPVVGLALKLAFYVMLRPANIAAAEWSEIDFEAKQWIIPAEKMKGSVKRKKTDKPHIVPLSEQALSVISEIKPISGGFRYLFPNMTNKNKHMSRESMRVGLRRLGYSGDEMTAHGFRSMASTRLYESGLFRGEIIERQLAHCDTNAVRAAYNRADYLPERVEMMNWWGKYLNDLKTEGGKILELKDYQRH